MSFKDFTQSSTYTKLVTVLLVLFIVFLVFTGGVSVGYHRAEFSNNWDMHYIGNFEGPRGFMAFFAPFSHEGDQLNSHGAIGTITSLDLPNMIIKGQYQAEQIVVVGTSTQIRFMRMPAVQKDLKIGQPVVVIGSPDSNGRIEAVLIRIMPDMPAVNSMMGSSSLRE